MVSILNEINENRREHILTVEDPVEFVFKDKKSIFSQREIGRDSKTFESALRAAMREDPDIIVV
jgi:twitching motility protein PilT